MTSTSPGTTIAGMSDTATMPIGGEQRHPGGQHDVVDDDREQAHRADDQERQRDALVERGGAEADLLRRLADDQPGSARTVSGVGMTHSSAVSRRNTSVMNTTQTAASMRLTATAGRR